LDETGFVPTEAQEFGEVHNYDDQMAGGYANVETFTSMQIFAPGGAGAWYAFNNDGKAQLGNTDPSIYGAWPYPQPALDQEDIWDRACAQ
jgi:hypothetical protein